MNHGNIVLMVLKNMEALANLKLYTAIIINLSTIIICKSGLDPILHQFIIFLNHFYELLSLVHFNI
jgi:hypothetical protein